jgi:hypothetical protein
MRETPESSRSMRGGVGEKIAKIKNVELEDGK